MTSSKPLQAVTRRTTRIDRLKPEKPKSSPLLRVLLLPAIVLYPIWFTIHYRAVYDPDIWWHLRAGEWVLQNHAVPRVDWLSTTGAGKPWILYSWIFDSTAAALYRAFGLLGPIVIYPVAMVLLICAVLWALTRELSLTFRNRALLLAATLIAIAPICSPRPGLCSLLFFSVELLLLLHARRSGSMRWLWTLPFLFALWANLHVQFIYGWFGLAVFAVEPWIEPRLANLLRSPAADRPLAAPSLFVLGLCAAATVVNPYLLRLHQVILGLATQAGQYRYISELQPPTFRTLNGFTELLVILAAWVVIGYRRNFHWLPLCFLLVGTFLAFRTVRDVWFGVLAAVVAMALPSSSSPVPAMRARYPAAIAAILLTLIGTLLIARTHPLSQAELWKDTADEFPVAAVEYVKQHHLAGPLYNDWNWGGFLIWNLPQIPVYVDSRTNLAGDETLERSIAVWSGAPDWASDPALSNARLIIANPNNALTSLLRFDPRFRVAYEDAVAVVLVSAGGS
jgi:hypothetical protein